MTRPPTTGGGGWVISVLVAGTIWVFWGGGSLAALVSSGVWPGVEIGDVARITVGTVFHLDDPAAAWPEPWRSRMPSAEVMYLGGLAALVTALAIAAGLVREWRVVADGVRRGPKGDPEAARWAGRRSLRGLLVRRPEAGRLTLGRFGRSLVAAEARHSVLVAGPTQAGKTAGLVMPAILEWQGPVVATSVKGDLLDTTIHRRREMGPVCVFDPTEATPHKRTSATPLRSCGSWQQARQVAHWLTQASRPTSGAGLQDANFWYGQAEKLIAPLLFSARHQGATVDQVVRWLDLGPAARAEVEAGLVDEPRALDAWQACQGREPKQLSSIYATAELILGCFADPKVARNSERDEYNPAALLDGGMATLYLVAPLHEQERLAPLFATMVQEVVRIATEITAAAGTDQGAGGLSPPLLLALDELANIAPLPDLDKIASTGAANGIQLLSAIQDLSQLRERFGVNRAQTIVNNHRARVFASGLGDPETLGYIQRVTGAGQYAQRSETVGDGRGSRTEGVLYRDLAPANVVREQKPGEAVLIYGSRPPARIRLRPWYKEKRLSGLAKPAGKEKADG